MGPEYYVGIEARTVQYGTGGDAQLVFQTLMFGNMVFIPFLGS